MDGTVYPCAGEIAEHYQAIGGEVLYFGKPYPQVYEQAQMMLGLEDGARILAIGDNLDTDIRGGNAFGVDTLLITGGVLRGSVMRQDGTCDHKALRDIVEAQKNAHPNMPRYYCERFGLNVAAIS